MSRWRRVLHWLRAAAIYGIGGLWMAKRQLRRKRSIVVLTFHRVLVDAELLRTDSLPGIVIGRSTFERLTAYVAGHYGVVRADHASWGDTGQLRLVFTFDDGWRDTYENAFAIARSYSVPFTVFVCPSLVGKNTPFWPERVSRLMTVTKQASSRGQIEALIGRLKHCKPAEREEAIAALRDAAHDADASGGGNGTMCWEQLTEMQQAGVTIASHGYSHEILTLLPERDAEQEIQCSRQVLEERLQSHSPVFAYPNGDHSPQVRRLVAANGYQRAFSTQRGAWTEWSDPLAIPRINVYEGNLTGPSGKFSGLLFEYTVFWKAWMAGC